MSEKTIERILTTLDNLQKSVNEILVDFTKLEGNINIFKVQDESDKKRIYEDLEKLNKSFNDLICLKNKYQEEFRKIKDITNEAIIEVKEMQEKPNKFWKTLKTIEDRFGSLIKLLIILGGLLAILSPFLEDILIILKKLQ